MPYVCSGQGLIFFRCQGIAFHSFDNGHNKFGFYAFDILSIKKLTKGRKEIQVYSDEDIDEIVDHKCLHDLLEQALSTISEREADVIKMRTGFNGTREMTLEEIAISLGLTRERIRQIEGNALRKLKHSNYTKLLREFL